jgi:hypothetical protein
VVIVLLNLTDDISMGRVVIHEIIKAAVTIILINVLFAALLMPWVTEKDIHGLPVNVQDRPIALFYFGITTFTTTGYGDIYPTSDRMRLCICLYVVTVFSLTASFFYDF